MGDIEGLIPKRARATALTERSRTRQRETGGRGERILKAVGAATAVMSLGAAVYGLGHFFYGVMHDSRAVADLIGIARNQQDREEFRDAWATLAEASRIEQTSSFVTGGAALHRAEEDLGMAWLENTRMKEGESFKQIAATVEPVLDRGLASAAAERKADLLAHLGWAAFLRSREQGTNSDVIEQLYRKALAVDPANPYANAMLGHWIMWNAHDLDAARPYFAKAADSGRAAGLARHLQLAALRNDHGAEAELEQVRVANELRKADQLMQPADRSEIWNVYYSFFHDDVGEHAIQRLLGVIPPEEHLLTFHWLFDRAGFDEGKELTRICYVGLLQEAAGRRKEALQTLEGLRQKLADSKGSLSDRVQAAIARLSTESR
jgi:hypothetical protein